MAHSIVVSGLVAKYSELSGALKQQQEMMRQLVADLDHVAMAIKLFAPEFDLRTIKVTNHRIANGWFEHGEVNRLLMDVLRTANRPLSTRQIGEAMATIKGIEVDGAEAWDTFLKPVLSAARRLEQKGTIKMVGRVDGSLRGAIIWALP
jgi:hypothetical protein